MSTFITVQRGFGRQIPRIPCGLPRFFDIVKPRAVVAWHRIIAVTQQALEFRISVETIAAAAVVMDTASQRGLSVKYKSDI